MAARRRPAKGKKFDVKSLVDKVKSMPPKVQQILLASVIGTAAMGWGYYKFLVSPIRASIADLTVERDDLAKKLEEAEKKDKAFLVFKRESALVESRLRASRERLPDEPNGPDFNISTNDVVKSSGLTWANLGAPGKEETEANYKLLPRRVTVTGDYHQLGEFFVNLARLKRLVSVRQVEMKGNDRPGVPGTVIALVDLVAYMYKPPPPPAKKKQKKKKKGGK